MNLLIDVGNTTIHYAIFENGNNQPIWDLRIESDLIKLEKNDYQKMLQQYFLKIKNCIISSVKPEFNSILIAQCQKYEWKFLFINSKIKSNITYNVENSHTMGADLIATAVAARSKTKNPHIIIVDMGTATTITCIKNDQYLGGSFLPGIEVTAHSLIKQTSLLTTSKWKLPENLIATNTKDALSVGIIYGHYGAIKTIITAYEEQLPKPTIFITGGNSYYLKDLFKNYQFENNLIFTGMLLLKELN